MGGMVAQALLPVLMHGMHQPYAQAGVPVPPRHRSEYPRLMAMGKPGRLAQSGISAAAHPRYWKPLFPNESQSALCQPAAVKLNCHVFVARFVSMAVLSPSRLLSLGPFEEVDVVRATIHT